MALIKRALPHARARLASKGGKARWRNVTPEGRAAVVAALNAARAVKRARRKPRASTKEAA